VGASGTFAAVYAAFARFDGDQSDSNRQFVRNWIIGMKPDERRWSQFFHELFSSLFGARHFSLKCLTRSILLSVVLISFLSINFYVKRPELLRSSPKIHGWLTFACIVRWLSVRLSLSIENESTFSSADIARTILCGVCNHC
jgi:hypothetical protein